MEIDYDKLADKIASRLKKNDSTKKLFTKNGGSEKNSPGEKKKGLLLDLLSKKKAA